MKTYRTINKVEYENGRIEYRVFFNYETIFGTFKFKEHFNFTKESKALDYANNVTKRSRFLRLRGFINEDKVAEIEKYINKISSHFSKYYYEKFLVYVYYSDGKYFLNINKNSEEHEDTTMIDLFNKIVGKYTSSILKNGIIEDSIFSISHRRINKVCLSVKYHNLASMSNDLNSLFECTKNTYNNLVNEKNERIKKNKQNKTILSNVSISKVTTSKEINPEQSNEDYKYTIVKLLKESDKAKELRNQMIRDEIQRMDENKEFLKSLLK